MTVRLDVSAFPSVLPELKATAAGFGQDAYIVGGAVRNALIGTPVVDLDVLVATSNQAVFWAFITRYAWHVKGHSTHLSRSNTWQVRSRAGVVEFSQLAVNAPAMDEAIEFDLTSRDFTVNAILASLDGEVQLQFPTTAQGYKDLHDRILRCPLDFGATFRNDPLRMLRACRFVSEQGFQLHYETADAMSENALRIRSVAGERVGIEMTRLLMGAYPETGLTVMRLNHLLGYVSSPLAALVGLPQGRYHVQDAWSHTVKVVAKTERREDLRWAALYHDVGKPDTHTVDLKTDDHHFYRHELVGSEIAETELTRLRRPKAQARRVSRLVALHMRPRAYEPSWRASAVRRLVRDASPDLDDLLDLAWADSCCHADWTNQVTLQTSLRERIQKLGEFAKPKHRLPVNGIDVMNWLKIAPGPEVGWWLRAAEEAVLEGLVAENRYEILHTLSGWADGSMPMPQEIVDRATVE